ncbi:MAG: hypothetical protein EXR71_12215 [Myxococcales bacterium]|nr:hypothetical protein [Myxococcales bacterium]
MTLSLLLALATPHAEAGWQERFASTIQTVEQMVWNPQAQALAGKYGLNVMNVTWEDTGRYKGSSVGPNISDMTIGVRDQNGNLHPMPVIRFDNFSDKTADVRSEEFYLRTGNEDGRSLRTTSLANLLQNPRRYLHDPDSWSGSRDSLWASRDEHVLVSAQACFLPIPEKGEATFTPVLYNYQSSPGNPAVLAILATREGTSMQVVENDGGYLSEALYFNADGERAPFQAERVSQWAADRGIDVDAISEEAGLDVVLLIQVPLKQREVRRQWYDYDGDGWGYGASGDAPSASAPAMESSASKVSDVEMAVVGHGDPEGPFTEFHDLAIERDTRFPVRVTVQFYKATSNGVVSSADIAHVRKQIDRVYAKGSYVGSLVTGGNTGRPTEWAPQPKPPKTYTGDGGASWADPFWSWHKAW